MPITPVPSYDGARYPTLEEVAAERRAFLRQIGLAVIAAAAGGATLGCTPEGGGTQPSAPPPTQPFVGLAGVAVPPRWPSSRGALVGGQSIEVTYADGSKGWVTVAAVFASDNAALEGALIDAEAKIADAVRSEMKLRPPAVLDDPRSVQRVEANLLAAIKKIARVPGLLSVAIARLPRPVALAAPPATPLPYALAAAAPAPAAPAAPLPAATSVPVAPRHLPRAGKCLIHGSGCTASEHGEGD